MGRDEKLAIDRKFAKAMHETATPFNLFDHPSWQEFFGEGMPTWTTPSPLAISTHLLNELYDSVQVQMGKDLTTAAAVVLGVDGATNVLARSMSNIIAHSPLPWFVEYLKADLKKETSRNLFDKVKDVIGLSERMSSVPSYRILATACVSYASC